MRQPFTWQRMTILFMNLRMSFFTGTNPPVDWQPGHLSLLLITFVAQLMHKRVTQSARQVYGLKETWLQIEHSRSSGTWPLSPTALAKAAF